MKATDKKFLIYTTAGICAVIIIFIAAYNNISDNHTTSSDSSEQSVIKMEKPSVTPSGTVTPVSEKKNRKTGSSVTSGLPDENSQDNNTGYFDEDDFKEQIDPEQLAEAETQNTYNKMFEMEARDRLPLVSIQTNNPVWSLRNEAERKTQENITRAFLGGVLRQASGSGGGSESEAVSEADDEPETDAESEDEDQRPGPEEAPLDGEFGKIQPPDGEIWIRIEAAYASESRDIMAQNADLYRESTGYEGPITITLWVGGRPHMRQVYEDE